MALNTCLSEGGREVSGLVPGLQSLWPVMQQVASSVGYKGSLGVGHTSSSAALTSHTQSVVQQETSPDRSTTILTVSTSVIFSQVTASAPFPLDPRGRMGDEQVIVHPTLNVLSKNRGQISTTPPQMRQCSSSGLLGARGAWCRSLGHSPNSNPFHFLLSLDG